MRRALYLSLLITAVAASSVTLSWHDGVSYTRVAWVDAGDGWGVRFDPPFECGWIETVEFYVHKEPDEDWDSFTLWLCEYRPGADIPGELIRDFGVVDYELEGDEGWVSFFAHYFWGSSDSFVIALIQNDDSPNCDSIGVDQEQTDPNPNFSYFNGYWIPFILKDGDFLMQVEFTDYEAVEAESMGRIKALYR
jgi:hypothetical protein